jgi:hypothetical protein
MRSVNARHVCAETRSTGPAPPSLVSRTSTAHGLWPISTQATPLPLLWLDLRHGIAPTSTQLAAPPLL